MNGLEMMLMFLIIALMFSVLVAWWARRKGKSVILYFFLSLFLSPMIAAIILQVSLDKKTPEVKEKKKLGIGYKIGLVFIILIVIFVILAIITGI